MSYTPSKELLEKYADVLVNFALHGGTGVKKGEVVQVTVPECAKPMYVPLRNAVLRAGAHPIMQFLPDDVDAADVFTISTDEQLDFLPALYSRGMIDQIDHSIYIIAEADKYELKNVDPKKIMQRSLAQRPVREWRVEKESAGKFTWTLAMYGTKAMADDVNMTEEEYWQQIIDACYLADADPIASWKKTQSEMERIRGELNALKMKYLHVEGEDVDLKVGVGANRQWLGGGGRNIPSFELFVSPDWRGTEGWIYFNQPLYQHGNMIEGIKLRFEKGLVVEATAKKNESYLKEMLALENANKIGEYSLTDSRFSKITKIMGETLFDENIGGEQGNTHLAVGNAYQDSYVGDPSTVTNEQWDEWGFNQSVVHTDIVSTTRRTVTAYLEDGSTKIIYQDGQFQL
jgi:aminopeptidase